MRYEFFGLSNLECFKKVTEIEGAHPVWVIRALINSSCDKRALGDLSGALKDASLVVKMPDATAADRATALVNRGAVWHALGDHPAAVRDYSHVIDDPGSPLDAKVAALTERALLREFTLADFPGALSDLLAVRGLDPQSAGTLAADIARCRAQIADDSGPRTTDIRSETAKGDELSHMSNEQLELTLMEMVKNLFHLRFQSAIDRLETPAEMQRVKRDVARIQAILRERHNDVHRQKLAHAAQQDEDSPNSK